MHVIRHDNSGMEKVFDVIVMQTGLQCDGATFSGQNPTMKCAECDEVALVISLKMREVASIECHWELT